MQKQRFYTTLTILSMLSIGASCRAPTWCGFGALRCIPRTADPSGPAYWEQCPKNPVKVTVVPTDAGTQMPSNVTIAPEPTLSEAFVEPETLGHLNPQDPSDAIEPQLSLASHWQSGSPSGSESKKPVSAIVKQDDAPVKDRDPLRLPTELPGSDTPPLVAPTGNDNDPAKYREDIKKMFRDLPPVDIDPRVMPSSDLGIYSLDALHSIARENHPGLRAAAAAVEAARGQMIQVGLPPNPNFGYEGDTINTLNTPGYHGIYLQQTFITARKLGLAAEAAAVDYANSSIELRKEWVTVNTDIRRAYFQVLAARQRVILAKALFELSDRAYQAQIKLVAAGESAPYEPIQLRVATTQARASLVRAQQDAIASWRRLAAATAVPNLEPAALDGRIDCPVPQISYEDALERLRAVHTDLKIAENLVGRNRTLVSLADRKPIPDLNVNFVYQRDYTFNPGTHSYNLMVGGAMPVFDRNQGNRVSARAELAKASQLVVNTENQLIGQLASAYGVYQANRQLASSYRTDALGDQVRAYRGIYQRYLSDPTGISFNDVIFAQQTIATTLNSYLDILQSQWQSTVDVGQLLQVDDIFQLGPAVEVAEIPQINN